MLSFDCYICKPVQWHVLWLLFTLFIPALLPASESNDIEIYVNNTVPDKIYSLAEIKAIFAMRKTLWPDDSKIRVFVLPDNVPAHRQFTKSKLNMFPHQFRRIWDRLIFSGAGQAPVEVDSFKAMYDRLNNTPGSIGYLKAQSYNGNIRKLKYE